MATDLSTVPVSEVRAIAVSERNKRQRMSDAIAESADRVRRSVTLLASSGSLGFARGYFGPKYKLVGADPSLLTAIGTAIVGAFSKGTTAAVAIDAADGAACEYTVVQAITKGAKYAADKQAAALKAANPNVGGGSVSGETRTPVEQALSQRV